MILSASRQRFVLMMSRYKALQTFLTGRRRFPSRPRAQWACNRILGAFATILAVGLGVLAVDGLAAYLQTEPGLVVLAAWTYLLQ